MKTLTKAEVAAFQNEVWRFGELYYRDLPWRRDTRGYYILVSEIMLQQTQVPRVVMKFEKFMSAFPDIETLANASLGEVLNQWLGLGYNRRARFLHLAAQKIMQDFNGKLPREQKQLESLPGVGSNTAGAIRAYAFNEPAVFVETNVRSVFFEYFFKQQTDIADNTILDLAKQTLPENDARQWYWALMDWGAHIKMSNNNIARSRHYKKQSKFAGSLRQMRGELLRQLAKSPQTLPELQQNLNNDARVEPALEGLVRDNLVEHRGKHFYISGTATV